MAPDFDEVHRELAKPKVTLLLVWNEYVGKCREAGGVPCQCSSFAEQYLGSRLSHHPDPKTGVRSAKLYIHREPGESVQVAWAGDPMVFIDRLMGVERKAWLFVATLSYSYVFVTSARGMAGTSMSGGWWMISGSASKDRARHSLPSGLNPGTI